MVIVSLNSNNSRHRRDFWDGAKHMVCSIGACIVIDQSSTIVFVTEFAAGECFIHETAVSARDWGSVNFVVSKKLGYDHIS